MRPAPLAPRVHFFVCANRRPPGDPLGAGCGDAGDAVFAVMKSEVARRGAYRAAWVTRTHCLGICPPTGCTVAIYGAPAAGDGGTPARILSEVTTADAPALFASSYDAAIQGEAR